MLEFKMTMSFYLHGEEARIMRKFLLAATSFAALMSANPASAATILFDFVGIDPADSVSFTIDSNPTLVLPNPSSFRVEADFGMGTNLVRFPGGGGRIGFGGFQTFDPSDLSIHNLYGPSLFSGSTIAPIFEPGVFELSFFNAADFTHLPAGTLTITGETMAAVPEPGTWLMMIIGFGAIGGMMRGRSGDARKQNASMRVRYR